MEKVLACGERPRILLGQLLSAGEREARDERLEGVPVKADSEAQAKVAEVTAKTVSEPFSAQKYAVKRSN